MPQIREKQINIWFMFKLLSLYFCCAMPSTSASIYKNACEHPVKIDFTTFSWGRSCVVMAKVPQLVCI